VVGISMPPEMKEQLDRFALDQKLSLAIIVRRKVAELVNFDVSTFEKRRRSRAKYATQEEAKAATAAKAKERNELVKALMEKYKKGEITI
jgi:hypothetical protein